MAAEIGSGRLRFTDGYRTPSPTLSSFSYASGHPPDLTAHPTPIMWSKRSAPSPQHPALSRHCQQEHRPRGRRAGSRELLSGSVDPKLFSVASNPEFLREGDAIQDFLHPERVLIGTEDEQAFTLLEDLYRPIVSGRAGVQPEVPFLNMSPATAELAKYASNAFLATKISFAQRDGPSLRASRCRHHRRHPCDGLGQPDRP